MVDTLAETVEDAMAKTPLYSLSDLKAEALMDRGGCRIIWTHIQVVEADTRLETLHDNLVETEVQTLGDQQRDVKFEALGMLHLR